jgi:hypothetical protein
MLFIVTTDPDRPLGENPTLEIPGNHIASRLDP